MTENTDANILLRLAEMLLILRECCQQYAKQSVVTATLSVKYISFHDSRPYDDRFRF